MGADKEVLLLQSSYCYFHRPISTIDFQQVTDYSTQFYRHA